jgi:hypothetical protein
MFKRIDHIEIIPRDVEVTISKSKNEKRSMPLLWKK